MDCWQTIRGIAVATFVFIAASVSAQESDSADPGFKPAPNDGPLGLAIPDDAKPMPPTTPFTAHDGRVVRVLSEIDDQRLIKLPTGRITVVDRDETVMTGERFRAASVDEMTAALAAEGFGDFKIESAGYYLFAYDCTEAYYRHTRSILESMLKGVVKQLGEWGLKPARPETRLVVVIMPNRQAFDAYDEMPDGVAAYYNGISNYVVLYEDDRLFNAAPEFALKQGSYVVAHEAIHQLLHNTGIQQRLSAWPAWISEGAPEYFCPLKVNSRLTKLDGDQLPVRTVKWSEAGMVNDLRMHDLLRTRSTNGSVIRTVVGANSLTAHGYSVAWGLTHYLAERKPKQFAAYLADVQKKPPLSRATEPVLRGPDPLFVKHFGEEFDVIEREVQRHLTGKRMKEAYRDPYVNQTHYVVSVTYKRQRVYYTKAGIALSPTAAREWTEKQRKLLKADGYSGHIVTRECKTAREARYHLRKILN